VIAILRHDLCIHICNKAIGQLRHITLNTVSSLSRQIGPVARRHSKKRVGPTSSSMPSSSRSLTSFFFLYQGTAHGSIGTQCRAFSALRSLQFSRMDTRSSSRAIDRDNERDGRASIGCRSMSPSHIAHGIVEQTIRRSVLAVHIIVQIPHCLYVCCLFVLLTSRRS
jgi:hypothetical protein